MIDQDIQDMLDTADGLLKDAQSFFASSDLEHSERCTNEAISLLQGYTERDDMGDERDDISQKHGVIQRMAHAYNRLNTIASARYDYALAFKHAEIAIHFCDRSGNLSRKAGLLSNIGLMNLQQSDYALALEHLQRALTINEQLGRAAAIADDHSHIGSVYMDLSDFKNALNYMQTALSMFEELDDITGISMNLANIGNVYYRLFEYNSALEYYRQALALEEEVGAKQGVANCLLNIGAVYFDLSDISASLEVTQKALSIFSELGTLNGIAVCLNNIGGAYSHLFDYNKALEYRLRALAICQQINLKGLAAVVIRNIGEIHSKREFEGYNVAKAEEYLLQAIATNEELGAKEHLCSAYQAIAELHQQEEQWKEAHLYFRKYHELEKHVHSEEARKAANLMEQRKLAAEQEKLRHIERAEARATQDILHKVLPQSIADRLVRGEKVADYFDRVSILFADIVGFTPIASRMPAKIVLAFLNHVFGEFDRIVKLCGCEKVKTIGDGYLAVAGAPIECSDHAERIARCALEMMNDIELPDEIRKHLPKGAQFSLRIGVHTGSVFAGIVGEERFVYDIYSDAVNIAARMESHGESGRIHCSDDFAHHLQNRDDGFRFEEREEIEIKGKGMMRTYFLEKA